MKDSEQKAAAKKFVEEWKGTGSEKQDTQKFWGELLHKVYGIENPKTYIDFEKGVKLGHTSFIDAFIPSTGVLIEQKSLGIDLGKKEKQSDGSMLTPFEQAKRYSDWMDYSERPRWIVTCNFAEFRVYDMDHLQNEPEVIKLEDLGREYYRLQFLIDDENKHLQREIKISIEAGEIVGKIYDAFHRRYDDPDSKESLHSLNVLCVRLVFCLYAENAGVFDKRSMFHDYMASYRTNQMSKALMDLFDILDKPENERNSYVDPALAAFPYVNGGLFSDKSIKIPLFTDEIRDLLLVEASAKINWADISPTIFGAVFESTLNPETRRKGGMHYTSVPNIHKVIDPLFLDGLKKEFGHICAITVRRTQKAKLLEFQKKLASLTFLDPACGSGNFLTETYLSLRRLENDVLRELSQGQISFGDENWSPIQVTISQFYGIEINDFAVTVAKTALWIAENQMMEETRNIVILNEDFLPLKTNACIVEGNALRMDWENVVPKSELSYIMGNPPFIGKKEQNKEQKTDLCMCFPANVKVGTLDYVCGWYARAAQYIQNNRNIQAAFVSTGSITRGQQPGILWGYLNKKNITINFAYKPFTWDSESTAKAHVNCVILGIGYTKQPKMIFDGDIVTLVENISPYIVDEHNQVMLSRSKPICPEAPLANYGSMPVDKGHLILDENTVNALLKENPGNKSLIRQYLGGDELINGTKRGCLWLLNVPSNIFRKSAIIRERIRLTREFREKSHRPQTKKMSEYPYLFGEIRQPETDMLVIPKVSSERRRYIPIDRVSSDIIVNGSAIIIPNTSLYIMGILSSCVHNDWMRAVCGRLEMRYQYSINIVYNNFPWPDPTEEQKGKIEKTAQAILDARALYPDSSLADLYDELAMPKELRKAHQQNDIAVMAAYGFASSMSEEEIVAMLMKSYQELAEKIEKK